MNRDNWAVGDGWLPLVEPLVLACEARGGTVAQVKEKFGGLRFYFNRPAGDIDIQWWDTFENLVRKVENLSYSVCEVTGSRGMLFSRGADGNSKWARTLSPKIALEMGYDIGSDN